MCPVLLPFVSLYHLSWPHFLPSNSDDLCVNHFRCSTLTPSCSALLLCNQRGFSPGDICVLSVCFAFEAVNQTSCVVQRQPAQGALAWQRCDWVLEVRLSLPRFSSCWWEVTGEAAVQHGSVTPFPLWPRHSLCVLTNFTTQLPKNTSRASLRDVAGLCPGTVCCLFQALLLESISEGGWLWFQRLVCFVGQ